MVNINIALPASGFPKPGEDVVWFTGNRITEGKLIGYDVLERPIIINQFDLPDTSGSFYSIRPKDPNNRIQPNWSNLPVEGLISAADSSLQDAFKIKLNERIPPGPSYYELIYEIYLRGYEIYLVGGTVRDFIQGAKSNDIDLVTTMPLKSALPLIRSMFNDNFSYKKENGYIRIGGAPASGDPFIDLKNFTLCNSGTRSSVFGSDIEIDLRTRDFACNAIYYDPINNNLVDPSGRGIKDAEEKTLFLVKDLRLTNPHYQSAQILIRLIKFALRGYNYTSDTLDQIRVDFIPLFSTMNNDAKMRYINAQIINKGPQDQRELTYKLFAEKMEELGFGDEYEKHIKPIEKLFKLN